MKKLSKKDFKEKVKKLTLGALLNMNQVSNLLEVHFNVGKMMISEMSKEYGVSLTNEEALEIVKEMLISLAKNNLEETKNFIDKKEVSKGKIFNFTHIKQ
jgi:hypothetical protein